MLAIFGEAPIMTINFDFLKKNPLYQYIVNLALSLVVGFYVNVWVMLIYAPGFSFSEFIKTGTFWYSLLILIFFAWSNWPLVRDNYKASKHRSKPKDLIAALAQDITQDVDEALREKVKENVEELKSSLKTWRKSK